MKINKLPPIEELKEMLSYDPHTGELRWKVKLNSSIKVGAIAGWKTARGYTHVKINGKTYAAHRIAYALHYGEDPWPLLVDHREGVEKGNAINNLRLATDGENNLNRALFRNNTSGHRGVSYHSGHKKWAARITIGGELMWLGSYECVEDAINARLKAEADNNIYVCAR